MFKSDFQHQFWLTKKFFQQKLGNKEDECVQDSDAALDAKILLFKSISSGSAKLHKCLEELLEKLDMLIVHENSLGKFLNDIAIKDEKNETSTHVKAIGKAISYESQQRICVKPILSRMLHELTIFNNHAVKDVEMSVNKMEKTRTEYRATLSWMKSISVNLDPDSIKEIQKFRKIQNMVKQSKLNFEICEKTCMEKIDLLAAARCNMLSHVLMPYQTAFLNFFENVTDVYSSTKEYLKLCSNENEGILKRVQIDRTEENINRLLFFEENYVDDIKPTSIDEQTPKIDTKNHSEEHQTRNKSKSVEESNLKILENLGKDDLTINTNEDVSSTWEWSELIDSFNNHKCDVKNTSSNEDQKERPWYDNIFEEFDPLIGLQKEQTFNNCESI